MRQAPAPSARSHLAHAGERKVPAHRSHREHGLRGLGPRHALDPHVLKKAKVKRQKAKVKTEDSAVSPQLRRRTARLSSTIDDERQRASHQSLTMENSGLLISDR